MPAFRNLLPSSATGVTSRLLALRSTARRLAFAFFCLSLGAAVLSGCSDDERPWHFTELQGSALPDLAFTMTRADDGKVVDANDYKGKVVLLYFGYTFCPDVCPLTLANTVQVLKKLGDRAKDVRVLFVTVDPARDTVPVLKDYVAAFAPEVDGLHGNADQLGALARSYRVAYSVKSSTNPEDYVVTHSSAVYVFDRDGGVRLLLSSLDSPDARIDDAATDLGRLLDEPASPDPLAWLRNLI